MERDSVASLLGSLYSGRTAKNSIKGSSITRPPFAWPGGKHKIISQIVAAIPPGKVFVDVFGGSGTVTLNCRKSSLNVYNDRYGGLVAFYNCLRDREKLDTMQELLRLMPHSPEMFEENLNEVLAYKGDFADADMLKDSHRAAAWYFTIICSFASMGRNWGYDKQKKTVANKFRNKVEHLDKIHDMFRMVQVDNLDWSDCLDRYDALSTVFYMDPPYLDVSGGIYRNNMTYRVHKGMLDKVFKLKGKVVMSHYDHPLYREYPWSKIQEIDKHITCASVENGKGRNAKEVIWTK
jgi:DNA adenine methylase